MLTYEQQWGLSKVAQAPVEFVIGVDEVGLGAIAGPLVVCGAVFRKEWADPKVKDSKKYGSHESRCKALKNHVKPALVYKTLEVIPHADVDLLGMYAAVQDAIRICAVHCAVRYPSSIVVVDGKEFPHILGREVVAIPKGDDLVPAVSGASVIAKTTRDSMMYMFNDLYPGYGFDENKGYLTQAHREAVMRLGPCSIHRRSYEPIKSMTKWTRPG